MAPTLRVPSKETPTFLNREAILGTAFGLAFSLVGWAPVSAAIGAVVGGLIGKSRMDQEQQTGKEVSEPTFWNKTALTGGLLGLAFWGTVAGLSIGAAIFSGGALSPLLITAGIAAPLTGLIAGGIVGKSQMRSEYAEAQQYIATAQVRGAGAAPNIPGLANAVEPVQSNTVTPQESQQMLAAQAAGRNGTPVGEHTQKLQGGAAVAAEPAPEAPVAAAARG